MFTLNCKGRLLVAEMPLVMGIINITPDSFYSGSRHTGIAAIVKQAEKMLLEGADILDFGGQSTRPGSTPIGAEEELGRVLPAIEAIHREFPDAFISVDTYHALVAKETVAAGASIINDISAGTLDELLLPLVASLNVPYILMHMQGHPQTMHVNPQYRDVTTEVLDFFISKLALLTSLGIKDVIIDPGFGFGKTIQHNFQLLRQLEVFRILERPLLLGISRKSTIYKTLGITAEEALNGTTVLHTAGIMKGAGILRVHDVREAREAVLLTRQIM